MSVEQVTNHAAIICYHQIINNNCTYMHIGVRDVNEDINFIMKFLRVKNTCYSFPAVIPTIAQVCKVKKLSKVVHI